MKSAETGVILAGGRSTRFNGTNKAFLKVGGRKIFDVLYDRMESLFSRLIVVTNSPLQYLPWDCEIVTDIYPNSGSLTGLHAGLFYAPSEYAFVTACDTPFLKTGLIRLLLDQIESGVDIVIPETFAGLEPLCAVYTRRCLKAIEQQLEGGNMKIRSFFSAMRVKKVPEVQLRRQDPELTSFFNINTPAQMAAATAAWDIGKDHGAQRFAGKNQTAF